MKKIDAKALEGERECCYISVEENSGSDIGLRPFFLVRKGALRGEDTKGATPLIKPRDLDSCSRH